jgi:hypothetical protein
MYLAQTNLELDLTKIYDLNGQEVYLTKPVKNCATQLMTKKAWEVEGRNGVIYQLDYKRKKQIKLK